MITRLHSSLVALLIQIVTLLLVFLLILLQSTINLSLFEWGLLQGICAGIISYFLRMPVWWLPIHVLFIPATIATLSLEISPAWFLALFVLLMLIYGKTFTTQVPLYLSSRNVNSALDAFLPKEKPFSFIDLGSGCGGLLKNLAKNYKNGVFYGIEAAPLPLLISKLRSLSCASTCRMFWGDFWKHDLSNYDVVYAYLSPVPMESLWRKAKKEMRPGSLLISNTFVIPGIKPFKRIQLNDFSNSTLYLWKI